MLRTLAFLAKRQRTLPPHWRGFAAAAEPAPAEDSLFLKFGSIVPQATNHTSILGRVPDTKVSSLANGLRIASEEHPHAETATVGVWIDAGSRFENDKNNGTAHFLEHMAFKGTKDRTTKSLEIEIENMGGHLNAYTSRETTCYFAKVLKRDVPRAVDILADILQNPAFEDVAIRRERGVILREMEEVGKQTDEVIFDHLHATAFQNSPLGRTILGPEDNIRNISRGDLADYISSHYTGSRMVLVAAGAVDHDAFVKLAEAKFSGLPSTRTTAMELVRTEPSKFTGSEVRYHDPESDLVHFAVTFKGAAWTDPDMMTLMVMQSILGSWNKRGGTGADTPNTLAQRVAADDLAESYMSFNTNYHDSGLFGMYAIGPKDRSDDLAWAIMQEFPRLSFEIPETEIERAKNLLKSMVVFAADGTTGAAEEIGRQLLVFGRRVPKAEFLARIDAVDAKAIRRAADRFLYDQDIAIAVTGDTSKFPDYNWFRRRTYLLRH